jgi:hypothetical protein
VPGRRSSRGARYDFGPAMVQLESQPIEKKQKLSARKNLKPDHEIQKHAKIPEFVVDYEGHLAGSSPYRSSPGPSVS